MPTNRRLSGLWKGRLVDVQGFEGELELNLKNSHDELHGTFSVEIGADHSTLRQQGEVKGSYTKKGISLSLVGKDLPISIGLTGDVLDLKDGGVGLRGVYDVSARTFSPLQGGIACASKDQRVEVEMASKRQMH